MRRRFVACGVVVLLGVLSACSSDGDGAIASSTIGSTTTVSTTLASITIASVSSIVGPSVTSAAPTTTVARTITVAAGPSMTVAARAAFDVHVVESADMPVLSRSASVATTDAVIMAGGLDRAGNSVASILRFDPATGSVATSGRLATAVHDAGAAVLDGQLFVFGGGTSGGEQSIVQSGPVGGDAVVVGKMPSKRSDHVVVSDGQRALIVGGFDGKSPTVDVLATTNGAEFTVVGRLAIGVRYPMAAVVGTKLYVFGGEYNRTAHDEVQIIDLDRGTTRLGEPLPQPRSQGSAVVLGPSIYLVGGRVGGTPISSVLHFDPSSEAITAVGELPGPLADAASGVVGNTAFMLGGETPKRVATVMAISG